MRRVWAAVLLACLLVGCAPTRFVVVRPGVAPAIEIRRLTLSWSNVYLVRRGAAAVLVDAGSPDDGAALGAALRREGLAPRDLRLVVLTHGHGDHAALAAALHLAGVPIALGRGDVSMVSRGRNDALEETSALGVFLRPLIDFSFAPFVPDVVVDGPMTLEAYGLPEVRIEPLPGHTPGSLVVWVGHDDVISGDVMLGGALGGVVASTTAHEHFYQHDRRRNHCNAVHLLDEGGQRFYVGHGGPVDRASVMAWRDTWAHGEGACP